MNSHTEEWAAGFFEGEGYIGFKDCWNKTYSRNYPRLVASIAQLGREPLDKFKEIFGVGEVRGPYGPYKGNRQAHFQYNVSGQGAVEVIEKMLPYLFNKGEQARAALTKYKEYNDGRA